MQMEPLYKIANTYLKALEELTDNKDLPIEAINDTLEAVGGEFEEKAANVAAYIRMLENHAEMVKCAKKELNARESRLEHAAQKLKEYLKFNMQRIGVKSIESPYFRIAVKNNPPKVVIDSEEEIPIEFRETKLIETINKVAIREALKSGEKVPGAHIEQDTNLSIA